MPTLPVYVYRLIFSFLPVASLVQCRLANRLFSSLATEHAFRHVRLEAAYDAAVFERIAKSDELRFVVREITVDSWVGLDFEYHQNLSYDRPDRFLEALPCLRFFPRLRRLNVRFDSHCGVDRGGPWGYSIEETNELRFMVLDTIFHCLAGLWTEEQHRAWLDELDLGSDDDAEDGGTSEHDFLSAAPAGDPFPQAQIEISSLTISNLAGFYDQNLTSSEAFKRVLASPSLTDLKMLVVCEEDDASPENSVWLPEKYDFFESLPQTWLAPSLAQNLRVLSLYCRHFWGWCPKMDFRLVNPGSGFPNLRVLALGNYIFSHDWQIDWVASLGLENGRGGLEELYLDDCPVMVNARFIGPLDESTVMIGDGPEDERMQISNHGYLPKGAMSTRPQTWNPAVTGYSLRWRQILKVWREKMTGLKTFRMGKGDWSGMYLEVGEHAFSQAWPEREDGRERKELRLEDTLFLNYDLDPPPADDGYGLSISQCGTGLRQERGDLLRYARFNIGVGPSPWLDSDVSSQGSLDEIVVADDDDEMELAELLAVVERRRRLASASAPS